jgi:serine/threonine-protein kinase HipA
MAAFDLSLNRPLDELYLWWLADPSRPTLIGTLRTVRAVKGVSLHYDVRWLKAGFPLSEDLPLQDIEFQPTEKAAAAGAVDDARPDRWGERVIRFLDKPPRLSLMEYLFYAGDERFGALGVSVSKDQFIPRSLGPLPQLADVSQIEVLVQRIQQGEPVPPEQRRLIAPGATMGGARPKALLATAGTQWVLKFAEIAEPLDMPLIEHATMTLAEKAGIRVAPTRPIKVQQGHAVAVQRFDRTGPRRVHALSAKVALRAAGEPFGYPELAQLLRRRGVVDGGVARTQMHELFSRMVFNILMDNTDDHENNHVLLANDRNEYELSPAFDVLPSAQALGYQQMRVGADAADSTLANALSECTQFSLKLHEAVDVVRKVAKVVDGWRRHFAHAHVKKADIESLAGQIDRPFLLDQRKEALS